ncbi:MAG: sensor histidine kinase [Aquabacterium sp.]
MSLPTPAAATPNAGTSLRGFLLRGLATAGIVLVIAAALSLQGNGRFGAALVYSVCIGGLCWLAVDGGRLLAAQARRRIRPDDDAARQGWPGWPLMAGVIGLGVPLAYLSGLAAGDALTGSDSLPAAAAQWRSMGLLLLVSVSVSLAITMWFYVRGRMAHLASLAQAAQQLAVQNQLRLLQSQLEPHMLFNTLANLRALIGLDPQRAQAMLDHLNSLLRATLDGSRHTWHPLHEEFARIADYLALIQVRMGDRLQVRLDLPDALRGRSMPPLLLQPLVENAVRHGLEPQRAGGRIEVSAAALPDGGLRLCVRDTGAGLPPSGASASSPASTTTTAGGYGTHHVRERLAVLYGAAARFSLRAPDDGAGGTLAQIDLPAVALLSDDATTAADQRITTCTPAR